MELNKQNVRKICGIIAFAVLLFLAVQNINYLPQVINWISNILSPLFIGAVIAFILNIPATSIQQHLFGKPWKRNNSFRIKAGRGLSILITYLLVIGIFIALGFIVVPELVRSVSQFVASIPDSLQQLENFLKEQGGKIPQLDDFINNLDDYLAKFSDTFIDWLNKTYGDIINTTIRLSANVINSLTNLFIGLVFATYIMARKEKLGQQVRSLCYAYLPEKKVDRFFEIVKLSGNTFGSFITSQVTEAIILGFLTFVTNTILQFPYALTISVVIGVLALVPIFGAIIGAAVGFVLILTQDPLKAIAFLIVNLVVQQLENNLIYPRTVGKSVGLPAMWVLAATVIGGAVWGVFGMLFMIPALSVLYTLLGRKVQQKLNKRKIPHYKVKD
ncbi:MAG: AI-2E family transporter [Oscillospiraceae bacterium]|nr:AI-2E family transporter [Oscillospiraceae bacterium]